MHGSIITTDPGTKPPPIWILTLPIGGGHFSVADALADKLHAEGSSAEVISPIARTGWLSWLPTMYSRLSTRYPLIWGTYYYARRIPMLRKVNGWFVRRRLGAVLESLPFRGGNTVVLTHSMFCHCLTELRKRNLRVIVLVTDMYGGPLEWFQSGADRYIVPTVEMMETAISQGLSTSSVLVRRLPTSVHLQVPKDNVASNGAPISRILLLGGSVGAGPIRLITRILAGFEGHFKLTVACGRNGTIRDELCKIGDSRITVLGFEADLSKSFLNYDLIITKPGPSTLMEILDSRTPLLIMPGIVGIEHRNAVKISEFIGMPTLNRKQVIRRVLESILGDLPPAQAQLSRIREGLASLNKELPAESVSTSDLI
jgi:processive 1,2-diacylglycerol beta-glucosyltransferase